MNRNPFFSFLLLFAVQSAMAQITSTSLFVQSNPTAVLSEWSYDNSVISYGVNVLKDITFPVILKVEIKLTDGTVVAVKDLTKANSYNLIQGARAFYASDLLPLEEMIFYGSYQISLEKNGKLPVGAYQISVQVVKAGTFEPVSNIQERFFNLIGIQLPILIKPYQNDTLTYRQAQTAITFRWTNVLPATKILPYYRIMIFEVLPDQTPLQALRANPAWLDKMVTGQTQYIWRPQISLIDEPVKRFIVCIQTLNGEKEPLVQTDGNGESRSEPIVFFIKTH